MTQRDPNTLDLTQQHLRIADDVMFWPVSERGELVYRIEIPKLHKFFRVGYEEYVLISLLDGGTTLPQACGLAAAKLGSRAPTASQAASIARWLLQNELAYFDGDSPPARRTINGPGEGAAVSQNTVARMLGRVNPFWIKIPLPQSERWVNASASLCRFMLAPSAVICASILIFIGALILITRWNDIATSSATVFHPSNWIWLLVTWVALKVVHELAHAVACQRQGGTVREAGVVLILFAPMAYVDVTSCWRMNSRWSRIAVAAAGMFIELAIASLAVILWVLVDAPQARFLLQNLMLAAGVSTLLFNANALMRFDGYFILADLIEVPNLYSEASSAVTRHVKRIATGEPSGQGSLVGWRKNVVLMYGVAACFWRVAICVSLAIAASTMFAGAGIAIAALGVFAWLSRPLSQLYKFSVDLRGRDPIRFVRAMLVGGVAVGIACLVLFWLPIPTKVNAPAIARYLPESTLRSRASGFVTKIHVADGASVAAGDVLIELENRELKTQLRQLELTAAQNVIRLRQATDQHKAGERLVLSENQKAISSQLENLRQQAAGLIVTAPRDGQVIARELDERLGTYVHEGDPLLVVADEADKEMVAIVAQDVINEVRPLVGSAIRVRTAGFRPVEGRLQRIDPRATDQLYDASLSATEGGTLAVETSDGQQTDEEALRMLEPHFRARVGLASHVASEVPAGMRMQVSFGYRADTLATRFRETVRRWWHSAHDAMSDE